MCLVRMIEKLRDGKLIYLFSFLRNKHTHTHTGEMEDGKLICLIEKKNDKMKIKVGINLQLYPY